MDVTLTSQQGELETYQLVLDPDEETCECMAQFADDHDVEVASFTAIGGFEGFTLGFYNLDTGGFDEIPFHEDQVELLSMMGEITRWDDGSPRVHAHVVVGRRDGTTRGGHLLRGVVRPILIASIEVGRHSGHDHHSPPTSTDTSTSGTSGTSSGGAS